MIPGMAKPGRVTLTSLTTGDVAPVLVGVGRLSHREALGVVATRSLSLLRAVALGVLMALIKSALAAH
jgi:hypothetical protein